MISKDNAPVWRMADGGLNIQHKAYRYVVRDSDANGLYKVKEVEAYLAEHPEALVPEPQPPEPSAEEKAAAEQVASEAAELELDKAYLRALRKADKSFKG